MNTNELFARWQDGQDAMDQLEAHLGYTAALALAEFDPDAAEKVLLAADQKSAEAGLRLPIQVRWPIILRRIRARRPTNLP